MADLFNEPPRIELNITGLAGTTVTVTRIDPDGNKSPVRSANPAPLSGGEWVGFDYEVPFGVPVTYSAVSNTGAKDTVGPVALVVNEPWLIHPGIPMLSRPVNVARLGDRTSDTNQGLHQVLGRTNPIPITDGSRHGEAFTVTLKTDSQFEADALQTLLADSSVLLLQISYPYSESRDYWWVSVGQVTRSPRSQPYVAPQWAWQLPCTVVDIPVGTLQATWTWQDVVDGYATWQDVVDGFPKWRDVVTDSPVS